MPMGCLATADGVHDLGNLVHGIYEVENLLYACVCVCCLWKCLCMFMDMFACVHVHVCVHKCALDTKEPMAHNVGNKYISLGTYLFICYLPTYVVAGLARDTGPDPLAKLRKPRSICMYLYIHCTDFIGRWEE